MRQPSACYYVFSVNKVFQFRSPLFDERTESLVNLAVLVHQRPLAPPLRVSPAARQSETGA